jgi:hypothetical protein
VLRVLADERLVDPDAAELDDRHRGRRDDAVEADVGRPEQRDDDQALEQHERLGAAQEQGVDDAAADGAPAQLVAREGQALVAHRGDRVTAW